MIYEELFKKTKAVPEPGPQSAEASPPAVDAHALLLALVKEAAPAKRRELLGRGLKAWPEERLLLLLNAFFELRYKASRNHLGYADLLLALLVEGLTLTQITRPPRSHKQLTQLFANNPLLAWVAEEDAHGERMELFFGECMQMLDSFVASCRQDKQYASGFLGLVKASPERVDRKIREDLSLLLDDLFQAEKAEKFRAKWTPEGLAFRGALELFLQNL